MTKYGDTAEMQKLAWGGAKSSVPDKVTAVQNQVTALMNIVLNRSEDYTAVPEYIDQIANTVATDILKSSTGKDKLTTIQILDMLRVLLSDYMSTAPAGETNWGNIRYI